MGFIGRKKFPFSGEAVDLSKFPSLLMNCQRDGKPWPAEETCYWCWYVGERKIFLSAKEKSEFYLIHRGDKQRVLYFSNLDQKIPVCEEGFICLSGVKTLEEALEATIIVHPELSRCPQRASLNPDGKEMEWKL